MFETTHASPRVCSTKTRIKTLSLLYKSQLFLTPRVCSTKTRIKTVMVDRNKVSLTLREYVPLKQGLRPLNGDNSWGGQISESMFH